MRFQHKSNPDLVAIHLYNDRSGSPAVLSAWLEKAAGEGLKIDVHTSHSSEGFLSDISDARSIPFKYQPGNSKIKNLINYLLVQAVLFFRIMGYFRTQPTVFVNTLLPFGPMLAAKLMGARLIVHVHETSIRPKLLDSFLRKVCILTASKVIFVSQYVKDSFDFPAGKSTVIMNSLSQSFELKAQQMGRKNPTDQFGVLMLGSLKEYKGIDQFVKLSAMLPRVNFELVLNASDKEVKEWKHTHSIPNNLRIYSRQINVHPFYRRNHLVVNMSDPDRWVETFGLTALEGMHYGLPSIVPPVGGIAEVVLHQQTGFHLHPKMLDKWAALIAYLAEDSQAYASLSENARLRAEAFKFDHFYSQISDLLDFHPQKVISLHETTHPKMG